MFYGDGMITPAISVLGAVEGLEVIAPGLHPYIVPVTRRSSSWRCSRIQKRGTARVGRAVRSGHVRCGSSTLAVLGVMQIAERPLGAGRAQSRSMRSRSSSRNPRLAFLALGAVVLAVTGTEALYADMGHFGAAPIRRAWLFFVMPALVLNYFGQGALLLHDPAAIKNPFYLLAPEWALIPLVVLATSAAMIASQAVISGAFSLTRAAIQMGYCPRLTIEHTSERADRADLRAVHQLVAARRGASLLVRRVPQLRQSRRRVRHRGDAGDADRLDPDLRRDAAAVATGRRGPSRRHRRCRCC